MKAWEDLLSSLEKEIGADTVNEWLRPMKVSRFDAGNLYLEATPFQISWFDEQIRPRIEGLFRSNNQRPIKIHWDAAKKTKKNTPRELAFQIAPDPIENEYSIESYQCDAANAMAYQIAIDLASGEKSGFNPVFISGPSGSGKTHLLMGVALALSKAGKKVFYVQAQSFTEHVVQAIRLGLMKDFRNAYREIDVLILDDIHLFARRSATQEEFFHTFNALHTLGRQMIISAQEPPNLLQDIEPRLISRFEWGIALKLDPPSSAQLHKILEHKAHLLDLDAPPELFEFLLSRFPSHPKASIEALHAIALRSPKNFNLANIERILSDLLEREKQALLTPDKIIKQTAIYFGIRVEDLTGNSQMREFAQPRQIAMFLCRKLLKMPFQGIGRLFDRDHSTVMTSIRQIEQASSTKFAAPIEAICKKLGKERSVEKTLRQSN
jgi:chromosomal replication initiator protein